MNAIRTMSERQHWPPPWCRGTVGHQPRAAQEQTSTRPAIRSRCLGHDGGRRPWRFPPRKRQGLCACGRGLQSGGSGGLVRKVRYDAKVKGRVSQGPLQPDRLSRKGRYRQARSPRSEMAYKGGVPQVCPIPRRAIPAPMTWPPSTMGGTVDPLTALYAVLRDVPRGRNATCRCQDVRRPPQQPDLAWANPRPGDTVACSGEYRRSRGSAPRKWPKRCAFPLRLTYCPDRRWQDAA